MNRKEQMKTFRVNRVLFGTPEHLALLVRAKGLKSAVKKLRHNNGLRLPDGTYYIFEAGRYDNGLQITFPGIAETTIKN